MSNNLSIQLTIDITPFTEALKTALNMGEIFNMKISDVLSGKIKADTSDFDNALKKLNRKITDFETKDIVTDIELVDKASPVIDKLVRKANKAHEGQKSLGKRGIELASNWGFALQGLQTIYSLFAVPITEFINLTGEQEKAEKKVEQAIKQTGMTAGFTAGELYKTASELQELSTFGDEDILNNVTAQMLTFTNVTGEQFKRAQVAALDLSTVLDGDLKSASIQLGKALNDPITNLSALSRSGIQFTKEQKKLIRSLWEAGDKAKAQSIILDELNRQYGGQAEAMSTTYSGALKQFSNAWGDLEETLGMAVLPILADLAITFKTVIGAVDDFFKAFRQNSLEGTIEELKSLGDESKGLLELQQLSARQNLIDLEEEMERLNIHKKPAEDIAKAEKERIDDTTRLLKAKALGQEKLNKLLQEESAIKYDILSSYEGELRLANTEEKLVPVLTRMEISLAESTAHLQEGKKTLQSTIDGYKARLEKIKEESEEDREILVLQKKILGEKKKIKQLDEAIANFGKKKKNNADPVADEEEISDKLLELKKHYSAEAIKDAEKRALKLLEIEEDTEIQRAEKLNASEETLNNIRKVYDRKRDNLKAEFDEKEKQAAEKREALKQKELDLQKKASERREALKQKEIDLQKKASDVLWNYENKKLALTDPYTAMLDRRKKAAEDFFKKNRDLLIRAGKTETELTEMKNEAILTLEKQAQKERRKDALKTFRRLANDMAKHGKLMFGISKALNIAQVVMETPKAAMSAYKAMVGIDVVGPALAIAAYGATVAQGAFTVSEIMKSKPPKAESGGLSGLLKGNSHADGGILIEAEGDEYITNKKRVRELGVGFFDFINFAPLDQVKTVLSGIVNPPVPSPLPAVGICENGGQVVRSRGMNRNIYKDDLKEITEALRDVKKSVEENSANIKIIVKNKSLVDVHKENMKAEKVYKRRFT